LSIAVHCRFVDLSSVWQAQDFPGAAGDQGLPFIKTAVNGGFCCKLPLAHMYHGVETVDIRHGDT
jgi:hypothetical protein